MAATNERVMEMVRREIAKNRDVSSQELFEKAKKMDSGMSRLSVRQFHASYPLQIKRKLKLGAGRGGRPRAAAPKRGPGRPPKVKRGPGRPPGRPRKAGGRAVAGGTVAAASGNGGGRDSVRAILIQFAGDVAAAEGKADVVQVIGSMDRYVERLLKAAGR